MKAGRDTLATGESKNCPREVRDTPVDREDESTNAKLLGIEMGDECVDLIKGMLVVYVTISLGFGDEKVGTGADAAGYDIGSVATDERRNRVAGGLLKVRADQNIWIALLYGMHGGNDNLTMRVTLRHLGVDREDARPNRSGYLCPGRRFLIADRGG